MYGQRWCIGSWVGVIDSLRVGLHHLDAWLRLAKKGKRRQEGGIRSTDGDGLEGFIHGENGNRMEECHGETETLDYEIHEPHD